MNFGKTIPAGCRCQWAVQRYDTGGDVGLRWVLVTVVPSCPVHHPDEECEARGPRR